MIIMMMIVMLLQFAVLFYQWKLETDFKEWMTDIDMEFFKKYTKFKEE